MAQPAERRARLRGLWHHHPLKLHIATLFTALVLIACGVIAWSNHIQGRNMVLSSAGDLIDRIHSEAGSELKHLFVPIEALVTWISDSPLTAAGSFDARISALPALAEALKRHTQLAAIYVGYPDGSFFLLRALVDDATRATFRAPREAAFLLHSVERRGGAMEARVVLLNSALGTISESAPEYAFDPRGRPWYVDAAKTRDVIVTAPYVFFSTRNAGVTIARRAPDGRAIVGADVTLAQMSEKLMQMRPTPSSQLAIFESDSGRVIAYSDPARVAQDAANDKPVLAPVGDLSQVLGAVAADAARFVEARHIKNGEREWLVKASGVAIGAEKTASFVVASPLDELLTDAIAALQRTLILTLAVILLSVPLTWWISRRIAGNLHALTDQAAAIRRFNFSDAPLPSTRINEIYGLGRAVADMRGTIRKFLDITTALESERDFERLLQRVLTEARDAAGGVGAIVYLMDDDGRILKPASQSWETRVASDAEMPPDLLLQDEANPLVDAARLGTDAVVHVVPRQRPPGMAFLDARFGAAPLRLITVPLRSRGGGDLVGMLSVFLDGNAQEPSRERLALVQAFAGAGAAAIDNQRLLMKQKMLLEALIGLVANAIDAKSPYTGGHCQRVPELTKMLARAACDSKDGPLAGFEIDADGWEALHIAAWLHDCGKVTTPEYVVDKATKLETLYDRIHEVRMRFEVLKRDAQIRYLEAIVAGGSEPRLRATLTEDLRVLDEEFAFVAHCNEGGEFMAPQHVERLKAIAARTWQRTLDDRLGLSHEEAKRMARTPPVPLPATEFLLADKPGHIIERGPQDLMPIDNPWGFKLKVPEHLYDRGELYNLSIARGTLTEEERYKINDHIVQTIIMLTKLPFPKHLQSVPELAGGHHEKMDGEGYPKRLFAHDMSVQARIMAIADIFEALTATDRPYKKGKTLSEAIKIMSFMKKDRHIDPELFDLFLSSGVYRAYAERYMDPQYIDEVDINAYLGTTARETMIQ